jgi:ferric iron reductase protein FhuF
LDDLRELRGNMAAIQGEGNGLQDMIDGVDEYVRDIKDTDDLNVVASLISRLYYSLGSFPFVYRCLVSKTAFIRCVIY